MDEPIKAVRLPESERLPLPVPAQQLRHGRLVVWPSELGNQYYCEQKVHLENTHPELMFEFGAIDVGEAGHEGLQATAVPITKAEIDLAIQEGKHLAIAEWTLGAVVDGVPIRGRPDLMSFTGRRADTILEFKFSAASRPFMNHVVQTATYGVMAERMGFEVGQLILGVVLLEPHGFVGSLRDLGETKAALLDMMAEEGVLDDIVAQCNAGREQIISQKLAFLDVRGNGWTAFLARYDSRKATGWVTSALQYWRGAREARPETSYPNKCRACPYNAADLCAHKLVAAEGFTVKRLEGRIEVSREWRGR